MTKQKELELMEKLYEGDLEALEEILNECVRISVLMASKYSKDTEERIRYSLKALEGFYTATL